MGKMTIVNPLFLKGLRKWHFEKIHKNEKITYQTKLLLLIKWRARKCYMGLLTMIMIIMK